MAELESQLREAVARALAGDWQRAHEIVQDHEEDPVARWIHAVVHQLEGDLDNARYWYRRSGRDARQLPETTAELREIAAALDRRQSMAKQ
jgi:hypothetical protein